MPLGYIKTGIGNNCAYCQNFLEGWSEFSSTESPRNLDNLNVPHHDDLPSFKAALLHGCRLCWLFEQYDQDHNQETRMIISPIGVETGLIGIRHRMRTPSKWGMWYLSLQGVLLRTPQDALAIYERREDSKGRHFSYNMRKWRRCLHSTLKVASDRVKLALRGEYQKGVSYATLSHCWGGLKAPMLTKSNINEFRKAVPFDKYIWIDSLCIVQDDEDDWNREAVLMCAVYGGSGLNIAAAGATDWNGKLFFQKSISGDLRRAGTFISVEVKGKEEVFRCSDDKTYSRCVDSQPLMDKAWVLQERGLAPKKAEGAYSYTQIVDVSVVALNDDQFGEIFGGVLTLSCEATLSARVLAEAS
ncbi:hypothetical protein G7Y89_g1381 [Cudoniella acicularis]|uniref:Heterokaryon incompatibility domain-containing protein n=1 Tax=Cudoniella acicularis TaxID=354080 RepID=A0A8H4RVC8_9HELO|nr:hypothetical protein G7Y89_g1381 [Cudoniella acicularis]